MNEVAPGIWHWSAVHPRIGQPVHSHWIAPARTVLDPLETPAELPGGPALRAVLSCRHHLRGAAGLGVPILAHEDGLHEFEGDGPEVGGFAFGDEVAPGIVAHEVASIAPDDTALLIAHGGGALALADSVIRWEGELAFVPDSLMGDDPETVKAGLAKALERLLELDFRHLLMAHGEPGVDSGKDELRAFLEGGTPSASFG